MTYSWAVKATLLTAVTESFGSLQNLSMWQTFSTITRTRSPSSEDEKINDATPYAPTNSFFSLGSYSTMYPATALAATVSGDARYIWPGPLRPGKFRFCALITT